MDTCPGPGFVLRATFHGVAIVAAAERSCVERALPRELRLLSDARDWHPLLFVAGDQTRGASRLGGAQIEWGVRYQEFVVAVPFVAPRSTAVASVYAAAMYSSHASSNWMGTFGYGYRKQRGWLERRDPIYAVVTPAEGLVFQAAVDPAGPWRRGGEGRSDALGGLQRIADLPWIGRSPSGLYVRSRNRWEFGRAFARPVEARASAHRIVAPGLPTGDYEVVRGASVEVSGMDWWLSAPRGGPF